MKFSIFLLMGVVIFGFHFGCGRASKFNWTNTSQNSSNTDSDDNTTPYPSWVSESGTTILIGDTYNQRVRKIDSSGIITTLAGTGVTGSSGDGGQASSAQMSYPSNVTYDHSGNVLVNGENVFRKINTTTGIISTFAGSTQGYSGDGGPATSAQLANVRGATTDRSGNIYLADTGNSVIRRVTPSGIISTVAGNNALGSGFSGDGGAATSAQLSEPWYVVVDGSGIIYISDKGNHRIRKISANGIISTFAADGTPGYGGDNGSATSAQLNGPAGLALDTTGNLYIADRQNHRIRKVNTQGIISTVAGTGTNSYSGDSGQAVSAELNYPSSIALDASNNLYIGDSLNHVIRKVDTNGVISTIAGTGSDGFSGDGGAATSAQFDHPFDEPT